MKKSLIIAAALILALSVTGCGNKNAGTGQNGANQVGDASSAYGNGETAAPLSDIASENVDMSAVNGDAAKSSSDKKDYDGSLGKYDVSIEEAKKIEYNGDTIAVVSISYKNNSGRPMPFVGALDAVAYQNSEELSRAVVGGYTGIDLLSSAENVEDGDEITIQMAYKLKDSSDITVEVRELYPTDQTSDILKKVFEF